MYDRPEPQNTEFSREITKILSKITARQLPIYLTVFLLNQESRLNYSAGIHLLLLFTRVQTRKAPTVCFFLERFGYSIRG